MTVDFSKNISWTVFVNSSFVMYFRAPRPISNVQGPSRGRAAVGSSLTAKSMLLMQIYQQYIFQIINRDATNGSLQILTYGKL